MDNNEITEISENQSISEVCDTLSNMICLMTYSECANTPMNVTAEYISAVKSAVSIIKCINEREER